MGARATGEPGGVAPQDQAAAFCDEMVGKRLCAAVVAAHQAGVVDNLCSDDCRQFELLTGYGRYPSWAVDCS